MLRQAVLLAGGLGTRLGALTAETPKPLLEVAGRPFLFHLIENLRRFGIDRFLLSVGYRAEQFEHVLGDGSAFGVTIEYVREDEPLGTGGALRLARDQLDETFVLANGDTLFDVNVLALACAMRDRGCEAAVGLRRVAEASRYGRVAESDGRVLRFEGVGHAGEGWINGGVYALRRESVDRLPEGRSALEADLLPELAGLGKLAAVRSEAFFIDIGIPDDLARSHAAVASWRHRPAVFFDRDGTLNEDPGYVHRPEDLVWKPEAKEAIRWLNDRGFLAIVATNQAGIAKGKFTETDFERFMNRMREDLAHVGAHLDAVYHCPYHPEGEPPYRLDSPDRKPAPGMFLRALKEWNIDPDRSFALGDS